MSESMKVASAAAFPAVAADACFLDDLLLFDFSFPDAESPPAVAAVGSHLGLLFEEHLDPSVDSLAGLAEAGGGGGGGGDEDEEELEWLTNKDAFPALETSFEIPSHSQSSRGSATAAAEGQSPVSVLMAAVASFPVPIRPRSKGFRRRGRALSGRSPGAAMVTPAAKKAAATAAEWRRCRHCLAEVTPQWREGPEGPKTLCNACGVRYKSGRLVPEYRPACSPTFSPAIHSNSHRRILEMRRRKAATGRWNSRPTAPYPLSSPARAM